MNIRTGDKAHYLRISGGCIETREVACNKVRVVSLLSVLIKRDMLILRSNYARSKLYYT